MMHIVPVPHSNTLGNFAQDEHEGLAGLCDYQILLAVIGKGLS